MAFEGGAASLLIVEDGEPVSGAGFFFIGKSNLIEFPLIMLDDVIKLKRDVGNDKMIGQLETARWRDVETIWPWLQEDLRVGQVAAGDVAGELARRMYQVPVVPKRQHCFFLSCNFHFAKSHSPSEILLVKRTQTRGVEVLLQDSVFLAEVHGVNLVTVHQVDHGQFGG
jgi:hypothetical protein